jgi:hypothetical protein
MGVVVGRIPLGQRILVVAQCEAVADADPLPFMASNSAPRWTHRQDTREGHGPFVDERSKRISACSWPSGYAGARATSARGFGPGLVGPKRLARLGGRDRSGGEHARSVASGRDTFHATVGRRSLAEGASSRSRRCGWQRDEVLRGGARTRPVVPRPGRSGEVLREPHEGGVRRQGRGHAALLGSPHDRKRPIRGDQFAVVEAARRGLQELRGRLDLLQQSQWVYPAP